LVQTRKNLLTLVAFALTLARPAIYFEFRLCTLALGRETCLNLNNLLHCYKKDLTGIAFALKMARGTPSLLHFAFALAPPRRKSQVLQIDQLNLQ